MTEIEKMKRYIDDTPKVSIRYDATTRDILAIMQGDMSQFEALAMAFDYGRAKGYRAAKAERRASV